MIDLVVSAVAALVLYKPFGVGGIVAGTGIGTSAAVVAQAVILRREFGGLELGRLFSTAIRITIASAALAGVGWVVWDLLDEALGRGLVGQIVSLGAGLAVGGLVYVAVAKLLRIAELEQITAPAAPPLDARPGPLPAGRRRAGPARRLRLARGVARCGRGCCPSFAGPPAQLATAVIALALLIWVAELLGHRSALFEPVPYLRLRGRRGRGLWVLRLRVARGGGRPRAQPRSASAVRVPPRQDPPAEARSPRRHRPR